MARDRYDDRGGWEGRRNDRDDRDDVYDDDYDDRYDDPRDRQPPPPNNLGFAIFVTLCCCTIGGIVAIVYSSQVNSKWAMGDYQGAEQAAANSKLWCWLSIIIGLPLGIAIGVLQAVAEQNGAPPKFN